MDNEYFRNYQKERRLKDDDFRLKQNKYMKLRQRGNSTAAKKRTEIINILGGECIKCKFSDIRALQIDHIDGGGHIQQKQMGGRYYVYKYYLENKDLIKNELQLLCANCNWIKREENKELLKP